jgi:Domain of unknown function (DUF2382)
MPFSCRVRGRAMSRGAHRFSPLRSDAGQAIRVAPDDAMTRPEVKLRVGTTRREASKARSVERIVTENATKTVPLQREAVRVHQPITAANRNEAMADCELTEAEHDLTLHEDEVTVDTQAEAKERVRMDMNVLQREVTEQVGKEQIETEGTPARR